MVVFLGQLSEGNSSLQKGRPDFKLLLICTDYVHVESQRLLLQVPATEVHKRQLDGLRCGKASSKDERIVIKVAT
eukprot:6192426-Pleurochrysis_carterae.AAC.1